MRVPIFIRHPFTCSAMLTRILIFSALFVGLNSLFAQDSSRLSIQQPDYILSLEGAGTYFSPHQGFFTSQSALVNLDLHFFSSKRNRLHLSGKIGVGYAGIEDSINKIFQTLIDINPIWTFRIKGIGTQTALVALVGKGPHYVEGTSSLFWGVPIEGHVDFMVIPNLSIGYRYIAPQKGVMFRIYSGFYGAGIGLGYSFPSKR